LNIFQWSENEIETFFFVLVRVTSLLAFLPIFGERIIPTTVRILFGVALTFVAFPLAWAQGVRIDPAVMSSVGKTIWALCSDIGFGMMIGFAARWVFDAVQFAGHFAGTTIGFSLASVFDPHTESQTISLSELQYIMAVLLFLSMDGHHIYLMSILKSLNIVPLGGANLIAHGDSVIQYLIQLTGEVIGLGLKLAAPVLVVGLIMNLTFGIMSRAVPQMNVLAVSFAANIIVGLMVVLLSLPGFVNMVGGAFDAYTPELMRFMRMFL
jgi:flagellar biosynthetic protein FliR